MRKRIVRLIAICMSCIIMILVVEPVRATTISDLESQKKELEKQKADAKKQQQAEENKYNSVTGKISGIEGEADVVAEEMEEMDAALVETIASVELIQEEVAKKEEQIEITTAELEEAKAIEEEQYEAMKLRIQFMYEKGDTNYLQLLLESQDFGDMVNKAEYVEKLYLFDRKLLEDYKQARMETEALKEQLETEMAELEAQQHELEEEQESLEVMLAEKQLVYENYEVQIAKAKQEAAVYKANIKKQTEAIRKIEAEASNKQSQIDAAKQAEEQAKQVQQQAFKNQGTGASTSSSKNYASAASYEGTGGKGQQIANYGSQFVGNPYVPGGTSLTDGADCSGFVWRVYKDFGYSVPRTSYGCRNAGTGVSYAEAQPGDILCYAGHVAIYVGNGQIVHASTQKTGIKFTNATYKEILSVRRIV